MHQGRIAFVRGVDKHGAIPPGGFPCRLAVLTWFERAGDAIEPWPLMRAAIPRISTLVGADAVIAEYWERRRQGILLRTHAEKKIREVAWASLLHSSNDALLEEDFPSRFRFLRSGQAVLHGEAEMWSLIGGPSPYHDSVTVSFFSSTPIDESLRTIFVEEAEKLGVSIGETSEAEPCAGGNAASPRASA
jgi:hypothetical protein